MCDRWVDFDIEWWRVGSLGGRIVRPTSLWRTRIGCVWKTECSLWDAEAEEMGREAKTTWSLALQGF